MVGNKEGRKERCKMERGKKAKPPHNEWGYIFEEERK